MANLLVFPVVYDGVRNMNLLF